ncbi:hypothetical protein CL614_05510 [archaeon]|nr:hypothetical protein [archaeon]|tara:strand:+ start:224 stop:439 length:216 start_codon:yes stop_codon:yes gene_type:complete
MTSKKAQRELDRINSLDTIRYAGSNRTDGLTPGRTYVPLDVYEDPHSPGRILIKLHDDIGDTTAISSKKAR